MRAYLTRVERFLTVMGQPEIYYNNLYTTFGQVVGRTDDGLYGIYSWSAIEIDPRTGLERVYDMNSIATTGGNNGKAVGEINDTLNFFGGVIAKVSEVVPTSPGNEITI